MAFSAIRKCLLNISKNVLEHQVMLRTNATILKGTQSSSVINNSNIKITFKASFVTTAYHLRKYNQPKGSSLTTVNSNFHSITNLKPKQQQPSSALSHQQEEDFENDSDSDDEYERKRVSLQKKFSERGDSEFWRRKMRTLHRILDVNRDGVISFEDFDLFAKRFTNLGHFTPKLAEEFLEVMQQTWEEQFGPLEPYNLITAEQFLVDLHHRLNDDEMCKRVGRFLPYIFKAVDYDHTGHLDLNQYKLFFRCLGLSDEDAAISFAVIDKNGDGEISLQEFVHLGRQYFLTEDETKISKMFWGPLITDH